jgi:hypothetical protein
MITEEQVPYGSIEAELIAADADPKGSGLVVYQSYRESLAAMKEENAALVFDYESRDGAKEAKSHIRGIRSVKGALEKARKQAKAAALEYGRRVDSEAKEIEAELDAMIEVHERPLKEIEEREARRRQESERQAQHYATAHALRMGETAESIRERMQAVEADKPLAEIHGEAIDEANAAWSAAVAALSAASELAEKQEAEAAELARLREEAARREAEDRAKAEEEARRRREDEIRAEAEATARQEAERQAAAREAELQAEADTAKAEAARAKEEAENLRRRVADPEPTPPAAPIFAEAASHDEIEMDAAMDFAMVVGARLGFEAVKAIKEGRIRNVRIDYGSR